MPHSKREARRQAGGAAALVWALAALFSIALTIAFWVVMIYLAIASIHYLNRH